MWYGVGLHATIHDRHYFPTEIDDEGTIYLHPGFHYSVALKPRQHVRKTEHIKKCLSHHDLYLFKTNKYNRRLCQDQCIVELMWKHCQCSSLRIPSMLENFANHHNLNSSAIVICQDDRGAQHDCFINADFRDRNSVPQYGLKPLIQFCPHSFNLAKKLYSTTMLPP